MPTPVYIASIGILFGAIVLVFAIRAFASVQQARARFAQTEEYRLLAEKAAAAQSATAATLSAIENGLAEVRVRLIAVEKILKAVE